MAALSRDGFVVSINVSDEGITHTEYHNPPDFAFIIYGGPWAHARALWNEQLFEDFTELVETMFWQNFDDWRHYRGGPINYSDADWGEVVPCATVLLSAAVALVGAAGRARCVQVTAL